MEHKNEGNALFAQGQLEKAITAYSKGVDAIENAAFGANGRDPDGVLHILYSNRSQVHLMKEQYDEAEEDATRSIAVKSDFGKSYLRRAKARARLGRIEKSIEDILHVIYELPALKDEAVTLFKDLQNENQKKKAQTVWWRARKEHRRTLDADDDWSEDEYSDEEWSEDDDEELDPEEYGTHPTATYTPDLGSSDLFDVGSYVRASGNNSLFPCQPPFLDFKAKCIRPEFLPAFPELKKAVPAGFLDMVVSNYFTQRQMDEEHQRRVGTWKMCDGCDKDLSHLPYPPNCICGATFCTPKCHKAHWKDHKEECSVIEENNLLTFQFTRRFWMAVSHGHVQWDPKNPATFSLKTSQGSGNGDGKLYDHAGGLIGAFGSKKALEWRPASDYRRDWQSVKKQWMRRGQTELDYYLEKEREDCKRRVMSVQSAGIAKINKCRNEAKKAELMKQASDAMADEFVGQLAYYVVPLEGETFHRLFFRVLMIPSFIFFARNSWSPDMFDEFCSDQLPLLVKDLSTALRAVMKKEFPKEAGKRKKHNHIPGDEDEAFSPAMIVAFVLDQDAQNPNNTQRDMRNFFFE